MPLPDDVRQSRVAEESMVLRLKGDSLEFKKIVFKSSLVALALVFLLIMTGEGFFHRHHGSESERDCPYCQWCHSGSQGTEVLIRPMLFPVFIVALLFIKKFEVAFASFFFNSGRSPPQNLL